MNENTDTVILGETTVEKDLGIMISNDLKVSEQCGRAAKKAMRILGMIGRTFKSLDDASLKTLYCSFVRPHLEYSVQAWSPYLVKDIATLEKVQRRAMKMVPKLRKLPYEERLEKLNLYPLEQRRLRGDLIETSGMGSRPSGSRPRPRPRPELPRLRRDRDVCQTVRDETETRPLSVRDETETRRFSVRDYIETHGL